jgi:hypothetical protein
LGKGTQADSKGKSDGGAMIRILSYTGCGNIGESRSLVRPKGTPRDDKLKAVTAQLKLRPFKAVDIGAFGKL